MLAQKPWLRVALFVVVAAIILVAVGALAYGLGAQNAATFSPRAAQVDRTDFNGPAQGGPAGQQGQGGRGQQDGPAQDGRSAFSGNVPQVFNRSSYFSNTWFSSPLAWIVRALLGAAFLVMLVLGVVAFFRTNAMQPAPAAAQAEVVEAPKKTAKKSK